MTNAVTTSNESESNQPSNRERIEKVFSFNPHDHLWNIYKHHNMDFDIWRELAHLISDTHNIAFNKGMMVSREMQCDTEHFKSYYNDEHLSKFALPQYNHRGNGSSDQSDQ